MDDKTNGALPASPVIGAPGAAEDYPGLTKREAFAMAAMQGILGNAYWNEHGGFHSAGHWAGINRIRRRPACRTCQGAAMNAQPKYPSKGPGDLTGPGDPQNEPESTGSVLDCPNETGTWLAENMAEELLAGAAQAIGDFISGYQDIYARNKLGREMEQLAQRCEDAIRKAEEGRRAA